MAHFSGVIALIILFSAPVWFAVGWWYASIERSKQHRAREAEWNHNLNRLRRDRDAFRDRVTIAHDKIRSLETKETESQALLQTYSDDSKSKELSNRLQVALEQAKQQISGFAQKVDALHAQSIEREDLLEQLKKKLTDTSRTLHDREQSLERLSGQQPQTLVAVTPQVAGNDNAHQIEALQHSIEKLTEENQEKQKKVDQLSQGSKVVEHQRSRLQTLQKNYDEQQEELKNLTRSVTENKPRLARLAELEKQHEAMQSKFNQLTQHMKQIQQTREVREQSQSNQAQTQRHDETMTNLRLNELNDVVEQHELTISKLRQQTVIREQQYDDELIDLHATMDAQERVVSQLREALAKPVQANPTHPKPIPVAQIPDQTSTEPPQPISHTPQSGDLFASEQIAHTNMPSVKRYDEAPEHYDNLKKINGIGPAFERSLNSLGLYEFEQIAALSPTDIEWVAQSLRSFPDRIVKGQWVEQAQKLITRRDG